MSESHPFNELTEERWVVVAPGVQAWEGTGFTVEMLTTETILPYRVMYDGKEIYPAFTLNEAKIKARKRAAEMLEMGLVP